ncbi:hypothetical protein [Rathayibacter sp. VKM Ac-2630]|uniref:hypothetical protein n=1 Tax=Rathayibacter sp. VKM Ac-2630 TaxID=1938617 RepID=UPI0009D20455|nr:hypothetical protein [Rathayibacter sp. VKM Ac-2630]OOB91985.1 hypothetical protein B0T42_02800 [Rathayibacter sp. VKM Ac-2630]
MDGFEERDAAVLADLVSLVAGLVGTEALDARQRDVLARALAVEDSGAIGPGLDALAIRLRTAG